MPVWLNSPCSTDGLGGVAAGTVGAWTSDGDMRLDRWFVRWMTASAPGRPSRRISGPIDEKGVLGGLRVRWTCGWALMLAKSSTSPKSSTTPGRGCSRSAVANDQARWSSCWDGHLSTGCRRLITNRAHSPTGHRRGQSGDVPVAYVPGLVMRGAADLYPGESNTDRRDAFVIADTARAWRRQVHWLDATSDEALEKLAVLNGFDVDLGADQTRQANRLRDLLVSVSPALERVLGTALSLGGVRDLLVKYPTPTALQAAGRA